MGFDMNAPRPGQVDVMEGYRAQNNERDAAEGLRNEWADDLTGPGGTYARWLERKVVTLAQQHAGAVDLIRLLPAVTLQRIVEERDGTKAAQAAAAAELDRRRGR